MATLVELSLAVCVGAVGDPVSAGDAIGAFNAKSLVRFVTWLSVIVNAV